MIQKQGENAMATKLKSALDCAEEDHERLMNLAVSTYDRWFVVTGGDVHESTELTKAWLEGYFTEAHGQAFSMRTIGLPGPPRP